jgi:hypothetical protein
MRRLVALAVAVLALPGAATSSSEPLLALQWDAQQEALWLLEVDPLTLEPAGRSLQLRDKSVTSWSGSPDGRLLALGPWDVPRITIVDRASLRVVREVSLRGGLYAQALAGVAPTRLVALVGSSCSAKWSIAVIDPGRGRVVAEQTAPGWVRGTARLADGLALLLAPPSSIGPARLAVARADGRLRTVH